MNNSYQPNTCMNVSVTAGTRGTTFIMVEFCIFVLLDIAALVGNSLVCLAFYRNRSLRTVTNYFVLSLALTDLSMAVLVMPLTIASTIATKGVVNDLMCKLNDFFTITLADVSLLTVVLLAINRYVCVVRPALYAIIFSKKHSVAMAICMWVVAIAVTTFLAIVTWKQPRTFAVETVSCYKLYLKTYTSNPVYLVICVIFISVPSIVMVACYIKIYQTIRHHNTATAPSSQGGHSAYGVEESKMTRMLTVVVVGFYLCWLPPLITAILLALAMIGELALRYSNFYVGFPFLASSVLNPMIYGTMSQSFRNEFWKILRPQP